MKHSGFRLASLVAVLLSLGLVILLTSTAAAKTKPRLDSFEFQNSMRKLWEDHITWTRMFIVSDEANLPDEAQTAQRLLQNQTDIGNAIKPFYGEAAGNALTALLKDHILIAAKLIDAAKAGDTAGFNNAKTSWYANANQIATFLHNANPKFWPLASTQDMMKMHLDLTLAEASDRLMGKWASDINDYDMVHGEILQMADMLSMGIIHQFPDMFKGGIN